MSTRNHRSMVAISRALLALMLLLAVAAVPAMAQAPENNAANSNGERLTVGTKEAPPFVMKGDDGSFSGISISLWEAVADKLGLQYDYAERDLQGLLTGLQDDDLDISVAALTVTAERESEIDFSYPFFTTGLAIAVPAEGNRVWSTISRFFSWQFFTALVGLALVLLGAGAAVWLFERRVNPEEFGGSPVHGLAHGFWWAAVTMTTVGYGDKSPRSMGGRIVGLIWMFAAVIIISSFTAAIATSLTVGQLSSSINGVQDLARAKVATVGDSAASHTLRERGIGFAAHDDLDSALAALADKRVDAVVYDAPLLRYDVMQNFPNKLQVLSTEFDRQDYAFALPQGSKLREPINRAILEYIVEDEWQDTIKRYIGKR